MKKINEKTMSLMIFKKNEHAKQTRKEDAEAQYLLILLYSSNYNILKSRRRFNKQNLKSFRKLISSQKLL